MWEIFNDDYTTHAFYSCKAMFAWLIKDRECPLESWETMRIRYPMLTEESLPSFCERNKEFLFLIKDALESKMNVTDWKKNGF